MWPACHIIVEDTRGSDERRHLEKTKTYSIKEFIVVIAYQEEHDGHGCYEDGCQIEPELAVAEELAETSLEERRIQQGKACSRKEHESDSRVVDIGVMEVARTGVMG